MARASSCASPPGTQDGKVLRVKGKGAKDVKGKKGTGDLRIKVHVEIPKNLDAEQKKAIEDFRAASPSPDTLRSAMNDQMEGSQGIRRRSASWQRQIGTSRST